MRYLSRVLPTIFAATLLAAGLLQADPTPAAAAMDGATQQANCGPGSAPETGVQGQVPAADRKSGRNKSAYSCNLQLVGQYQGEGASWVSPSFGHCEYQSSSFPTDLLAKHPGVSVIDAADAAHPKLSTTLTSPAMLTGTWESLKVNEKRGLLAAVSGGPVEGALFFDVYDISQDCAHPKLLNTGLQLPANLIGHEGQWSPDGNTYWSASFVGGLITAIDVRDPAHPKMVYTGGTGPTNHGFSFSDDGNRMYLASATPAGVTVLDTSDVQKRKPVPMVRQVGQITWSDGLITQHTIPVTYKGKPYLVAVDEMGSGGVRFLDISDEKHPKIVSKIKLQINMPDQVKTRQQDTQGDGLFGYEAHYCSVDRPTNPTKLACGYMQSGIRVFDISNYSEPKEIAYYNPPAQVGKNMQLLNSEHASALAFAPGLSDVQNLDTPLLGLPLPSTSLSADYCSSPPQFHGDQLWASCMDNGFLALRFTNGAGPKL